MRLIAMFDEFSSKENATHVIRPKLKNVKDVFSMVLRFPLAIGVLSCRIWGHGGLWMKPEIEPEVAKLVKRAFAPYVERDMGVKEIVPLLNEEGSLRRGKLQ